ncbi:MAG: hypothetical protein ACRDGH_03465 [Candidatus Limnocylindria bacterium]
MKVLERERADLAAQAEHLDGLAKAAALDGQARLHAEQVLAGWAEDLAAGPVVAREALRKIVQGPIAVRPEEDGSRSYEAPCGLGAALGGVIGREPEIWKVTVGTAPAADLDGGVKILLSRRSVSPS